MGMLSDREERPGPADSLATRAALSIDPRLAEVWQLIWSLDDTYPGETLDSPCGMGRVAGEVLGPLLRLAYMTGYADASEEGEPMTLFGELGVRAPRATPGPRERRPRRVRARFGSSGR
jgi:hypothetical protein